MFCRLGRRETTRRGTYLATAKLALSSSAKVGWTVISFIEVLRQVGDNVHSF